MKHPKLYTIGYEGADLSQFLDVLKESEIALVADVRAVALSRKKGFSKTALSDALEDQGIGYRHFRTLGTPRAGREAARAGNAGLMNRIYCQEVLGTEAAHASLEDVALLAKTQPLCLLCFERDPASCHRRILARLLEERGWETVDLSVP